MRLLINSHSKSARGKPAGQDENYCTKGADLAPYVSRFHPYLPCYDLQAVLQIMMVPLKIVNLYLLVMSY